jgi:hypothetical protein
MSKVCELNYRCRIRAADGRARPTDEWRVFTARNAGAALDKATQFDPPVPFEDIQVLANGAWIWLR